MLEFDLSFLAAFDISFLFTLTNEFFSCKSDFSPPLEMVEKSHFYRNFSLG
ncbi:hypothetical protein KSS87_019776 [Heliosperma pusillum]|nr:hypothetical protein KSS87_019776 [Heliosperma pusillum]